MITFMKRLKVGGYPTAGNFLNVILIPHQIKSADKVYEDQ